MKLLRWLLGGTIPVWYHPAFRLPLGKRGQMDPRRADNVLTWLLDRGIVDDSTVSEAPEARFRDLRRVHSDEWLATIDDPDVQEGICGDRPANPQSMVELWRRGCGGVIEAARHVRNGGRAGVLMGGFHHAAPDRGSGFCALNDIAVAIAVLRDEGFTGTILVIDLDAHPPDGLAAFAQEDVEIRSVSVDSHWTGEGFVDVRVPQNTGDDGFLDAVRQVLEDLPETTMAFYLAGADPLLGDPLGMLSVSEAGLRGRDSLVFAALGDTPTVIVPAGGYTKRAWVVFAHTLAEAAGHRDTVADDYDPIAARVGRVARSLAPFEDEIEITEADIVGLSRDPGDNRFLGRYTRHGLEHAFVRYGLFDTLEANGFADLAVTFSTTDWPHKLWVEGSADGTRHRLAEVALRFSQFEGYRLLFIDWLELKDPRRSAGARKLPGQKHPGLGLAREVIEILGVTARRLNLAGLQFVPSHFHVARIARRMARHPDPQARGEFLALRELLAPYPLGAVSRVLHKPGLPTEDGEMMTWTPANMIHAIDPGLFERLKQADDEARRVKRNTLYRLVEVSDATFAGR